MSSTITGRGGIPHITAGSTRAQPVVVLDGSGNPVTSFSGSGGTASSFGAAFPSTGTAAGASDGANMQPLLVDGSGFLKVNVAAGGTAGIQYTEGDIDATITGTAMLMEGAANTLLPVQGTVAAGLLVNLGSNNAVTVTGTVTANAGTNLNTSALALESGGNLATMVSSLGLIDDTIFAEDVAANAADKGISVLAVRRDTASTMVGTDNDYTNLIVDSAGRLHVQPGTTAVTIAAGATTIGKAEDAAHTSSDVGVMALGVRNDAGTTLAGTDGDYIPLSIDANGALRVTGGGGGTEYTEDAAAAANPIGHALILIREDGLAGSLTTTDGDNVAARGNNKGELYVKHTDAIPVTDNSGSLTVDNAGTFAVQATIASGATSIAKAEDVASADADVGVPALAVRKAAPANTSGTDGDYEFLQMSAGRLWTSSTIDAALPAGANAIGKLASNAGVTIGAVEIAAAQTLATVTNVATIGTSVTPGTSATHLGKAEDAAHTTGDVGVMALSVRQDTAAALAGTDADYQPLITDASGRLHVNVGNTVTVGSHAVTNAGTFAVQSTGAGDVAHDAADSGNPVKIGMKAVTSPKGVTLVTDADRTNAIADLDGIPLFKPFTSYGDIISERVSNTDGASTAFTTFDNAAGTKNYITTIIVHNAHATTDGYVDIRDGTAGSVIATIPAPHLGGSVVNFPLPLRQPTAATALAFDVSAAITTIYITVVGFKSKA